MTLRCLLSRHRATNLSKLRWYTSSYRCVATGTISTPLHHPWRADNPLFSVKNTKFGNPFDRFIHTFQQAELDQESPCELPGESEDDPTTNEFLSRFVWIMRKKLCEAYPDCDKPTIDCMLVVIVEKVVGEIEKGGPEQVIGAAASMPSDEFSEDLWRTVWEVSNVVLQDMAKEKKKEKMKSFLHDDEVKAMYRFAGEVGIRGDLLRELRFKWARQKMEQSEFYQDWERDCKEELLEKSREELKVIEGARSGEENVQDKNSVDEDNQTVVSLPKRHGKIKYKVYGLNLSDPKWTEVADKIHENIEVIWPQEPKPISGKCKIVTEKIISLREEDDPAPLLREWMDLLQPSRIDWVALLDRLKEKNSHLYLKIAELVLGEDSFQTNIRDYSKLIDIYARENRLQDAERILKKMNENGIVPDVILLTIVIQMYCKSGNLDKAIETFESLKTCGFQPDMKIYNSMVMAYVNAGEPLLGESLVREMETRDIKPTKEIFMALLRSFVQRGDAQGARRISQTMQFAGLQPTLESSTLMIQAYAQANDSFQAKLTFDQMMKYGNKPDDRCVASMIAAYEKKNELEKALDLLLELEKDGFEPGVATYTNLVDWFAKMGLIDEAEQILDKITKQNEVPPFKLHVSLCDLYSKAGVEKKARQTLGVIESKIEQLGPSEFERIILSLRDGGFVEDAQRMHGLMEARGFTASQYMEMRFKADQAFRNCNKSNRTSRNK